MTFDVRMPARCWIAPEIPTATYSVGETVFPVWPTWSPCGRQPASTTARDAPTAALPPNARASSSSSVKFTGSLSPRPPEMTIGASATSTAPAAAAFACDVRHVHGERDTEPRRDTGREVLPRGARSEQDGPVPTCLRALGHGAGPPLRRVATERGGRRGDDPVGAVLGELVDAADRAGAQHEGLDLPT